MKPLSFSFRLIFAPILMVFFVANGFAQQSILHTEVERVLAQTKLIPLSIFDLKTTRTLKPDERLNGQATTFKVNRDVLEELLAQRYTAISFNVPTPGGEALQLELIQNQIFTTDFQILERTENGARPELTGYPNGLFFKGIVVGRPGSWAAISFFEHEIAGMIALDGTNLTLALQKDEHHRATNTCIVYDESQLREKTALSCGAETLNGMKETVKEQASPELLGCPPVVRIYFECDYDMYLKFGSSTAIVTAHVAALFNCVAVLFANENIKVKISTVYVWATTDPYAGITDLEWLLYQFSFDKSASGFPGDLAHLLFTRPLPLGKAGLAFVKGLCSPDAFYHTAYSNIDYSPDGYPGYPAYSFNVFLVSHELGHNLGSRHTHWCGWPGGPIDNCKSPPDPVVENGPSCSPGPTPPPGGGTIMSYCVNVPTVGVDFSNGFGNYPGNAIRSHVAASSCLWPAGPLGPFVSDIGATTANVSWTWGLPPCAVSYYRVTWRVVNANSFMTVNTNQTSLNLTGLNPSTNYIVKVDALTTDGVWTDANSAVFVTLPFPVYCASSGLPATPAWIDKFKLSRFPDLNVTKTSGNNAGYANFTATVFANLKKGSTYTTNISQGYSLPSPLSEYYYIWIDFNKDKDFADPGELVFSKGPTTTIPVSGTFAIPLTVLTGNTRMRVRMTNTGISLPCASAQWGEVEDYTINIVSAMQEPGNGDGFLPGAPTVGMRAENALTLAEPKLIPNPVANGQSVRLSFQLLAAEAVQVQVFDLMGQQVWSFGETLSKGSQLLDLPAYDWDCGTYFVRMQSPSWNSSMKLIVTR